MKWSNKLGPARLSFEEEKRIMHYLEDLTGDFSYSYDVLLPEGMARYVSLVEGVPLEEALKIVRA